MGNEYSQGLYYGLRVDNRALGKNLVESAVTRDFYIDDLVVKTSNFIKLVGSMYFLNVLDNYCVCTFIEDNASDIYYGCCDVLRISSK